MSRNRLTWRSASAHPATPWEGHTHPASYEDPVEDAYGIDSDFGAEVHEGPYVNGMPPASQGWVSEHPASRRHLERKASRCIQIAQSMLGKTASAREIEDQALALMDLSDGEVNRTLSRVASSFMVAEDMDEDDDVEAGMFAEDMEAHDLFDAYDVEGNGMISRSEFGGSDEVFDAIDLDEDDMLSPYEVSQGLGQGFSRNDALSNVENELDYLEDEVEALEDELGITAEDIEADRKWGQKGKRGKYKGGKGYLAAPKARKGIKQKLTPWVRGGANKEMKRYNRQYAATYLDEDGQRKKKGRRKLKRTASEEMATYMDLPQNHAHAFYSDDDHSSFEMTASDIEAELASIAEEIEACGGMYAEDVEGGMYAEDVEGGMFAEDVEGGMFAEDVEACGMTADEMYAEMYAEDGDDDESDVEAMLAEMLEELDNDTEASHMAEDAEACTAEDTDLNASLEPSADDTMGLSAEDMEADDTLAALFKAASDDDEDEDEDEDETEDDEEESKGTSKKASLKPQGRKSSEGVKSLGAINKEASSEVNDLAKLWESAPDVKAFF